MLEVKYTIHGLDLFDVSPACISHLVKATDLVFHFEIIFSDFNVYGERMQIMSGKPENGQTGVGNVWASIRFRTAETGESFQEVHIQPADGRGTRLVLPKKQLQHLRKSPSIKKYTSSALWDLNEKYVRGRGVASINLDRGERNETVTLVLNDGTQVTCLYAPDTFVGLMMAESANDGINYVHYILEDVDPSISMVDYAKSKTAGKDFLVNVGLRGKVQPLLKGRVVSFREPSWGEEFDYSEAAKGDKYVVIFKGTDLQALNICKFFEETYREESGKEIISAADLNGISKVMHSKIGERPQLKVGLSRAPTPGSKFYALTLELMKKNNALLYRGDMRALIASNCLDIGKKLGNKSIGLL